MEGTSRLSSLVRFGIFELDRQAVELRRQGSKVRLQQQPFQVLANLLERPGEIVTREELQKKLWPADTFVDFERGLNRAINKLRAALGDNSDNPRFIETLPRRGYRFIAPVEVDTAQEREPAEHPVIAAVPEKVPILDSPLRRALLWAAAGLLAAAMLVSTLWRPWRTPPPSPDRQFLQFDLDVGLDGFSQPALSPDGSRIVFFSKGGLSIRRLDQAKITRLAGTDGAYLPFFSPNGQWIAFVAAEKLQKVPVEGGVPTVLCNAVDFGGGSWGNDDNLVIGLPDGISRVPAGGGLPRLLTSSKLDPSGITHHFSPQVLPGNQSVLFAAINGSAQGSLRVLTINNGKLKTLVEDSTYGRYLNNGYLVYYQQGTLFATRMDLERLELIGSRIPLVSGVSSVGGFGRPDFDLSRSGALVYRGGASGASFLASWLSASGKIDPALPTPGNYATPRLSPDGKRLAFAETREGKKNLWVYDLIRDTLTRLTSGPEPDLLPTWSPDGEYLAFRSGNSLAWARSDGSGKLERLPGVSRNAGPWSFSADGKWLAFFPLEPRSDLWTVPVERTPGAMHLGQPRLLLQQSGSKGAPAISPDDRWVAYTSDESGSFEIYVIPFSPRNNGSVVGKWAISNGGGVSPKWARNGRELFYQGLNRRVQVAAYTVRGDTFAADKPRVWSETRLGDTGIFPAFDVAPDGNRIIALLPADDPRGETLVRVLLNVDTELHRRLTAPTR